jgi:hypothetical protein
LLFPTTLPGGILWRRNTFSSVPFSKNYDSLMTPTTSVTKLRRCASSPAKEVRAPKRRPPISRTGTERKRVAAKTPTSQPTQPSPSPKSCKSVASCRSRGGSPRCSAVGPTPGIRQSKVTQKSTVSERSSVVGLPEDPAIVACCMGSHPSGFTFGEPIGHSVQFHTVVIPCCNFAAE